MKGLHSHNLPWIDPWGEYPSKEPEHPDMNDSAWHAVIQAKLSRTHHLKVLWFPTGDAMWRRTRDAVLRANISAAAPKTLTVRVMGGGQMHPARYAQEMWTALRAVKASLADERTPIWWELGNEWNLESEGFQADPARYISWVKGVVQALRLWGDWRHGLFAAAPSPQDPAHLSQLTAVLRALLGVVHGQALHAYNEIGADITEQATVLDEAGLGFVPLIGSELGSVLSSRMDEFKRLDDLPLIAYHIWVVDGKSNGAWDDRYILTPEECKELE